MMMDLEFREQAKLGLNRWDQYRKTRQTFIDKAIQLIKAKKRTQVYIALMKQSQILSGLTKNYILYKNHCLRRINNFFLAIKFKVRFRLNFCKRFGTVYDQRIQKYLRRHLTILAPSFYENKCEKSKVIIQKTLARYDFIKTFKAKSRKIMDQLHRIQSLWKRAIINSGWRRLFCAMAFSKEVDYLVWVYEKKLKFLKGPHSKTHKFYETTIEKLHKVKDPGVGSNYHFFPCPISHQALEIIKKYQERMSAEYTLDYSIWQFQILE